MIFLDPPYELDYERQTLALLAGLPFVTENTLIVVEASRDTDFTYAETLGYAVIKEKCYRTNKHVFLKKI